MTQDQQIAQMLLALVDRASVQCDDVSLANVLSAKNWLRGVACGALVMKKAKKSEPPKP